MVMGALAITTPSPLPPAQEGVAYAPPPLVAVGGTPPNTWAAAAGFPAWLALDAATGALTGTPGAGDAGPVAISVTVTDSLGATETTMFALQVNLAVPAPAPAPVPAPPPPALVITTPVALTPGARVGRVYTRNLVATGGTPPYTWTAPGLPAWLTLTPAGVLSGTAPAGAPPTVNVNATVTDAAGATANRNFALAVTEPARLPGWLLPVAGLVPAGLIALIVGLALLSGGKGNGGGEEQAVAEPTATPRVGTTPSATATPGTAAVPNPFANGSGGVCRLDKVGTWSEGNNPHRIEVGGHGGQHLDFYPQYQPTRIYAVSYIVDKIANPDGVPDIAWGFGSIWEGDTPECASYDWVADASRYARARLDSGHSGLVIDLRSNPPKVVTNLRNLSQTDIVALLAVHSTAMRKGERGFEIAIPQLAVAQAPAPAPASVAPAAPPYVAPAPAPAPSGIDCAQGTPSKGPQPPNKDQAWRPGPVDTYRVVNVWSNAVNPNYPDHKLWLEPGQNVGILGGSGDVHSWSVACGDVARKNFDSNGNTPTDVAELSRLGLLR